MMKADMAMWVGSLLMLRMRMRWKNGRKMVKTRRSFVLRVAHHIFLKVFLVNSRFLWGGGRLSFVLCLSGLVVMRMRRWGVMRVAMLRMLVMF